MVFFLRVMLSDRARICRVFLFLKKIKVTFAHARSCVRMRSHACACANADMRMCAHAQMQTCTKPYAQKKGATGNQPLIRLVSGGVIRRGKMRIQFVKRRFFCGLKRGGITRVENGLAAICHVRQMCTSDRSLKSGDNQETGK